MKRNVKDKQSGIGGIDTAEAETAKFAQWDYADVGADSWRRQITQLSFADQITRFSFRTFCVTFYHVTSANRENPDMSENMLRSTALSTRIRTYTTRSYLWRFVATSRSSRLLLRATPRPTRYYAENPLL